MKFHIRSYVGIFDVCSQKERKSVSGHKLEVEILLRSRKEMRVVSQYENRQWRGKSSVRTSRLLGSDSTTLKNVMVDPPLTVPYLMSVCLDRSSAFSMGLVMRSTVRKAAKLAV